MNRLTMLAAMAAASLAAVLPAVAQEAPQVTGFVQKVDEETGKIVLKHGAIPNLDMGEMTMVFLAGDRAMLGRVKKGDKVRFTAERVNGRLTVTSIVPAE